jgi:hypothetical protein
VVPRWTNSKGSAGEMSSSSGSGSKPPGRWSDEETALLAQMRAQLGTRLTDRRQLPDVVGDRRLLRFLRGHGRNVNKACEMFSQFLNWRDENKVDDIRDNILRDPCVEHFPSASKILALVSQIVVAHDALDNHGNPICFESFSFDPDAVLKGVTKDEYIEFMIYTLEYRAMVLDQMSDEKEEAFLKLHNYRPPKTEKGYGVSLQVSCIRECSGLGLGHVSASGRTVLGWIIALAGPNYPETLFRSYMVKVPFMIDMVWVVIKQFMDPNTVAKNVMLGSGYLSKLQEDMPKSSIPKLVGGAYTGYNTPFCFNEKHFTEIGENATSATPIAVAVALPEPEPAPEINRRQASPRSTNASQAKPAPTQRQSSERAVDPNAALRQQHNQQEAKKYAAEMNAYAKSVQTRQRFSPTIVLVTTTGRKYKSWLPPSDSGNGQALDEASNALHYHQRSLISNKYIGIHRIEEYTNANEYLDMTLQLPPMEENGSLSSSSRGLGSPGPESTAVANPNCVIS